MIQRVSDKDIIDHNLDVSFLQDGYADFISRWTAEEEGEFNDRRFHASGLGLCKKRAVLKKAGYDERPLTEEKKSEFAEANFIHAGMTTYWMRSGTAIAREQRFDDLPREMHSGDQKLRLCSPFPGWTGKFDALLHRPEWCGPKCDKTSKELAGVWDQMVMLYNAGDEDWKMWRDIIKRHVIIPGSLKTVHPNGLRHYVNGPKLHNVYQDSWYVAAANKTYDLEWDRIMLMYRGRGGGGKPFFFVVKALDMTQIMHEYEQAWTAYEEDHELPDELDLEANIVEDKTWGPIVRLSVSWQCGYCDYAGWTNENGGYCCTPNATKNATSDRVAVVRDNTITLIQEWYQKSGYDYEMVVDCIEAMMQRDGLTYAVDVKPTDRSFK